MKIALDGTPLVVSTGGIWRSTRELGRTLAQQFPEDEYWLLSDQPFTLEGSQPGKSVHDSGDIITPYKDKEYEKR